VFSTLIFHQIMELNATDNISIEHFDAIDKLIIAAPDYINLNFLLTFINGMYHGIEIQHPLYAVLILDLLVVLVFNLINIFLFFVRPTGLFMQLSLANGGIAINFHFTSWCLASVIRYIYIVHGDWIDSLIPNLRWQCLITFATSILFSISLSIPLFGYIIYLGKVLL